MRKHCAAVLQLHCPQLLEQHGKAQLQSTVHDLMCMTICSANLIVHIHSCWSAGIPAETSCFGCTAENSTVTDAHPLQMPYIKQNRKYTTLPWLMLVQA